MTTYTAIPDANLEPGKPARSVDAILLRDNPIAITEGAAGAPRVQAAALSDFETGSTLIYESDDVISTLASNTKIIEAQVQRTGTISVTMKYRRTGGTSLINSFRIYKNGVAQGATQSTTSTVYQTYSLDLSVSPGDLIQIFATAAVDSDSNAQAYMQIATDAKNSVDGVIRRAIL